MPCAFRGMTMTGKILVFISNMIKDEGRPRARKMIELSPACIQSKTEEEKGERGTRPTTHMKESICSWHRRLETWCPRPGFTGLCSVWAAWVCPPGGSRRRMALAVRLSCLALETQETNHSPRVWCHGGHTGTPEEPLTLAGLQESRDLHPGTGRGSV